MVTLMVCQSLLFSYAHFVTHFVFQYDGILFGSVGRRLALDDRFMVG